jgi:4-hydroxybutyryl-CoA dehydratase/vinylacetyl-CoA-Delta-isomerase
MTYQLANDPSHDELMNADSKFIDRRVNRFTHLHQSTEDLVNKIKMQRLLGQSTACCFQRCVGLDTFNALDVVSHQMDQDLGTSYNKRFREYLVHVQEENLVVDGAMTDPKGNRKLSPSQQADPDLYVHIVQENEDGIVIRGAKAHQTGAISSHEILVMPTRSLRKADQDYAVVCAMPADAEGIVYVYGRQASDTRKLEGGLIDVGNYQFGGHEALIIFQDVFIPWEWVFMCREYAYAGSLVELFAANHRASYGGCKVGVGDVLIGAVQALARVQGTEEASHIKDKLVEMVHLNETIYACGLAASYEGTRSPSGTYRIYDLLANITKLNVTRFPYELARIAQDIAGGLLATLPSEKDFNHPEVGPLLQKYMVGSEEFPTERRQRLLRLIENLTLGVGGVGYLVESMHGAGSPMAQRIMLTRLADMDVKEACALKIAGLA